MVARKPTTELVLSLISLNFPIFLKKIHFSVILYIFYRRVVCIFFCIIY